MEPEQDERGQIFRVEIFYDPRTGNVNVSAPDLAMTLGILELAAEITKENLRSTVRQALAARQVRQRPNIVLPGRG